MLSMFRVSSRIVANINDSSLLFSQHFCIAYWGETLPEDTLFLSLELSSKILLFQIVLLIFFAISIISPYFRLVGLLLHM